MATLTGTQIANTYKQLLQVGSGNNGLTASVQNVQDGQGNNSPLQLSQSAVNIDGTFQLNGVTLTANASALNDIADLTGATGIIAVSGGNVYGRTLTGGTGVSITNADGTEGNPTIALNPTGVVSASYGPATNIEINSVGQVVSAGAVTSVSVSGVTANTFTGGTFAGTTGDFSSNVSVGGNLVIAGQFSPASLSVTGTINATKISATDATFNNNVSVGGNLVIAGQFSPAALSVTGTVNAANISATDATFNNNVSVGGNLVVTGQLSPAALSVTGTVNATKISATNATFNSVVSAGFFVGDGSGLINVPSVEGGTVKFITAGTGIKLTVDAAVTTTIPVSGTVAVSANQNFGSVSVSTALAVTGSALFGIVSATNIDTDELLIAGVSAATVTEVAAVSALTQINLDSITSINGIIEGNVSADSGTFNTLTVVTSASVGGTFNVGGNVGIGTASPAVPLHISSATPAIRLTDTDDNSDAQIGAASGGLIVFDADINNEVAGSAILFRVDGGSEKMRITSTGNVGIGTSSPLKKLDVSSAVAEIAINSTGSSYSRVNHYHNGTVLWTTGTRAATDYHIYRESGGGNVIIDNSNVGIGNTAPSYLLDLYRSASTVARIRNSAATGGTPSTTHGEFVIESTDANMGMQFLGSTTANQRILFGDTDSGGSGQVIYDHTSNYMALSVAGAERMRITSTGNVGIGISSPATKFHVLDGTSSLRFRQNGTVAETLTVGPSGGDAAVYLGDVADTVRAGLYYDTSENDLQIRGYNNSTRILIDSSGNVGIGTTAPDGNLNVQRTAASAGWIINGQTVGVANDSGLFMDASNNIELAVRDGSGTLTGAVRSSGTTFFNGGNVGINTTTTLGAKLFVSQGAAASPATSGNMTTGAVIGSSTAGQALNVGTDADGVWYNAAYANNAGVARIHRWLTGGTERMRIDTSGTVTANGILKSGSTGSNGQFDLARTSDGLSVGKITMTESSQVMNYNNVLGSGIHSFSVNNTERMRINSSGNVGIGTTSPSTQIGFPIGNNIKISQVVGTAHLAGNAGSLALTIADGGGHSGVFINNTHNGTYSSQDITFLTAEGGVSAATERMRIDSSGNVGIGVTTIDTALGTKLHVAGTIRTDTGAAASNPAIVFDHDNFADADANYIMLDRTSEAMRFNVNASERMRIDSSGTLLVGMTASSDTLANTGIELYNNGRLNATRTGNPVLYLNRKTSGGTIVTFRLDGGEEGTISIDSSSGVSYNTTSDYRLKENITEVTGAANRVKALNPVRFNFIAAPDKIVDGFLAHEVSNIVPEAIHGEKDAIDAEGNPKYQGIDQSKLVPLLTAALQEALTKIDELEARVAALETA